jgi:glycine/D-amino acid oxidase-like deaminating enzyme
MPDPKAEVAIIGAGISGIASAYYLAVRYGISNVVLIDAGQPMGFTSAQSGENYRNWWPHPAMVEFTNHSIDLMQDIARDSNNRINMTRRGYVLATRADDIEPIVAQLQAGLGEAAKGLIRFHPGASSSAYTPPCKPDWEQAPEGVDILQNQGLIRRVFPSYAPDIRNVIHIRRGGDISGQQLGMYMLEAFSKAGGRRVTGTVKEIRRSGSYTLKLATSEGGIRLEAEKIVNAAGPFAGDIARMLDVDLPIFNIFQQKIAFEDKAGAIRRDMPFSIDLDGQRIDWTEEERDLLRQEPEFRMFTEDMPGAIHCRPDGGDAGRWVKLGWAYNTRPAPAAWEPPLDRQFPEIVLRGAARLNSALRAYYGKLPRGTHHYGGWYTMTEENWPLIGPMGLEGAYMNCALSGFGTMAACAGGELCAAWVAGAELPGYARELSMQRYEDAALMALLRHSNKGVL